MGWKVEGRIRLGYLLLQIDSLADWQTLTEHGYGVFPSLELSRAWSLTRRQLVSSTLGVVIYSFAFHDADKERYPPYYSRTKGKLGPRVWWIDEDSGWASRLRTCSNRPHPPS